MHPLLDGRTPPLHVRLLLLLLLALPGLEMVLLDAIVEVYLDQLLLGIVDWKLK